MPTGTAAVGVDVVDVGRFRSVLRRRTGLLQRLFTPSEREHAGRFADPVPHLAARFAAKEAVMKALGVGIGGFGFSDVEVTRRPSGRPGLCLTGAASRVAGEMRAGSASLSMSHTGDVALAVVVMDLAPEHH